MSQLTYIEKGDIIFIISEIIRKGSRREMKKMNLIGLSAAALVFVLVLSTGCGGEDTKSRTANKQSGVSDVLQQEISKADAANGPSQPNPLPEPSKNNSSDASQIPSDRKQDGIDVDLTVLSANMVYAEVYNMMISPKDYVNKTIKMEGTAASYHDDKTKKDYYACIIKDATACCSQGIEFELTGDYKYPGDGQHVSVTGVFTTYKEGDTSYCTLKNARLG